MSDLTASRKLDKLLRDYQSQISSLDLEKPRPPAAAPPNPPRKAAPPKEAQSSRLGSFIDRIASELETLRPSEQQHDAERLQPVEEPSVPQPAPAPEPTPIPIPAPPRTPPPRPFVWPTVSLPALTLPKISLPTVSLPDIAPFARGLRSALPVLLIGAGGLWLARHAGSAPKILPLDYPNPVGIIRRGDDTLLTGSRSRRVLFTLDASTGKVKRSDYLPNSILAGLSNGERTLWSTDSWEHKIFQHRLSDFAVIRDYPSPGPKPSAIFWDGEFLWTIDQDLNKIYQHRVEENKLPVVFEAKLSLDRPVDLWRIDGQLWILDAGVKKIFRYDVLPTDPKQPVSSLMRGQSAELAPLLAVGAIPTGFELDGGRLSVLTDQPPEIRLIDAGGLAFKNDSSAH